MANLAGKVALVTGAGQGVGQGIALALAAAGATVAVTGRTESKIADTLKTLTGRGGKGLAIVCDVFKAEDIARTVARTVEALGGIDILVNNAYDGAFGPLLSLDDDAFMRGIHAGPLA
jgi:NAD(P)-dependent dehydrogenase (short-subunit alcohol dehydrogenase family)